MKYVLILAILIACAHQVTKTSHPKYSRSSWKHWTDDDGNCLNMRQEILKSRSLVKVKLNKKGCTVVSGKWDDYYYPEIHTKSKTVDIDHLVPLKLAHDQGGYEWSAEKKERFANDPENLVITNRSYNRKKGAKSIDQWLPVHQEYACKYIRDWKHIKKKYGLMITESEQKTIQVSRCD